MEPTFKISTVATPNDRNKAPSRMRSGLKKEKKKRAHIKKKKTHQKHTHTHTQKNPELKLAGYPSDTSKFGGWGGVNKTTSKDA